VKFKPESHGKWVGWAKKTLNLFAAEKDVIPKFKFKGLLGQCWGCGSMITDVGFFVLVMAIYGIILQNSGDAT